MIPPPDSLLKYNNPVLISKSSDRKSPKVSLPATPIGFSERYRGKKKKKKKNVREKLNCSKPRCRLMCVM